MLDSDLVLELSEFLRSAVREKRPPKIVQKAAISLSLASCISWCFRTDKITRRGKVHDADVC